MTTITTSVPEHSLRHDRPGAATNLTADGNGTSSGKPGRIDTKSGARAWPFTPDDAPPLAWWRTLPYDAIHDAEHLLLLAALEQIAVLHGDADFAPALKGEPSAAINVAFSLMPISEMTLRTDIAMSVLLRCVLEHNASAALVLAQVLGLTDLGHSFATELAASWLTHGLRYSADPRKFREAQTVLEAAFRERRRDGDDA